LFSPEIFFLIDSPFSENVGENFFSTTFVPAPVFESFIFLLSVALFIVPSPRTALSAFTFKSLETVIGE